MPPKTKLTPQAKANLYDESNSDEERSKIIEELEPEEIIPFLQAREANIQNSDQTRAAEKEALKKQIAKLIEDDKMTNKVKSLTEKLKKLETETQNMDVAREQKN